MRSIKNIIGYTLRATDGEIGKIHDFYFDDERWTIRYLIVNTEGMLVHHEVLISPVVLQNPEWDNKILPVSITRKKVERSPEKQAHQPVSRRKELDLAKYYTWPAYWAWSGMSAPIDAAAIAKSIEQATEQDEKEDDDLHLRSIREVSGYNIRATDESIGHVEDFIVDVETWVLRYLIIDTRNWLPGGKKVLISPMWAKNVDWGEKMVHLDLPSDKIKESPEFDPSEPVKREYEELLHDFYKKQKYWL